MVGLKFGLKTVDLPYTVRIPDVTEQMFEELVDEDTKAELIDGVMVVHSPATLQHDDIGGFLRALMRIYARRRKLGKVLGPDSLVHLATCRLFAPDIFFIKQKRVIVPWPKQFDGAPNQATEVLSPTNREDDLEDKRPAYRAAGVEEIWFVDPVEEHVIVDRRRKQGYATQTVTQGRLTSTVLQGFWIETAWLWAQPLPDELSCLEEILSGK